MLDEGVVRPLGAVDGRPLDVRLIATTNRDIEEVVRQGEFRADLLYRISAFRILVPPLRERRDEIPGLATRFLAEYACENGGRLRFSEEAMEALLAHPWCGNIRELRHAVRRAAAVAHGDRIRPRDLPREVRGARGECTGAGSPGPRTRYVAPDSVAEEKPVIAGALAAEGGNRTRAALRLGMARSTLWLKMKLHGLTDR